MLEMHKPNRKLLLIPITSILSIGAILGIYNLIYITELSHAETVDTVDRRTIDDITYMQDMTPEICQTAVLNKQYTLTDSRDGNTYTIARIKNQTNDKTNCWMTQNLRILDTTLTPDDSDVTKN